jgi:hypothetical protein
MMPHSNVDFGKCVRAAQAMRRYTNKQIGDGLGTTPQQVSRFRNNTDCKINTAISLADFFEIPLQEMLELDR